MDGSGEEEPEAGQDKTSTKLEVRNLGSVSCCKKSNTKNTTATPEHKGHKFLRNSVVLFVIAEGHCALRVTFFQNEALPKS